MYERAAQRVGLKRTKITIQTQQKTLDLRFENAKKRFGKSLKNVKDATKSLKRLLKGTEKVVSARSRDAQSKKNKLGMSALSSSTGSDIRNVITSHGDYDYRQVQTLAHTSRRGHFSSPKSLGERKTLMS